MSYALDSPARGTRVIMSQIEQRRTACNRDCPDVCSILVDVEDGVATRLSGDPDDPITRGFLCERTGRFLDRQYHADRFNAPMLRVSGRLQPISWDEAFDLIAERMKTIKAESGAAAILDYRSGGSLGMLTRMTSHLLALFGPVSVKQGDICSGAGEAAQVADMGVSESHDIFDILNSRTIFLWGKDVHTSGVHLLPILKEARRKGAKLIGLDVRPTRARSLCDTFVLLKPGGDPAVALGMARHLFDTNQVAGDLHTWCDHLEEYRQLVHRHEVTGWAEQCDVKADVLRQLADALVEGSPASLQIGWGLARRTRGSTAVRTIDALSAISGNLGIPGGGASFYYGRSRPFDTSLGQDLPGPARGLKEACLGREILEARDPDIRMVWITAGNPVSMLPDSHRVAEALRSREFVVVVDTHPTDTTDVADLVLPTTTLLEDDDLMGAYGNHFLRASMPAVEPPEGVLHELAIVQGVARRLGLGAAFAGSIRDWKERAMAKLKKKGVTLEDLEQKAVLSPFREEVLFRDHRFKTPSGRFQLLQELPPEPAQVEGYPLRLLATSSPRAQSSQWAVPPQGLADRARVHPSAAAGFSDGDRALLQSRHGEVVVTLCFDENQHPEVVVLPKGGMLRDGICPNALITARETDAGGGAVYYDEPLRLQPVS